MRRRHEIEVRPLESAAAREAELGTLRAGAKSLGLLMVVALALPTQALVLVFTRGRASMRFPPFFHAAFARVLGVRVRQVGTPLQGRGVVHVSNHLSYLDVQVLGRVLRTRFVAKEDVRAWPLFGLLSRLQQTVFISRARHRAGEVGDALSQALAGEHGLLLFPEGTTSDGSAVLPFKSSVFAPLLVVPGVVLQPVRIELLSVDGVGIAEGGERDLYAYYGDATLVPHLWKFMRGSGAEVQVRFLEPIALGPQDERKALARTAWTAVAGASEPAEA
jgi:1-acyl-sn-glycerol-3-phosphate acyltransferase